MDYQKFVITLERNCLSLSYEKSLRLAITVSKKLFFDYQSFFETHEWGNPDLLLDAINASERSLSGEGNLLMIEALIPKIKAIIPDTDDFGDYLGSYALNASVVVHEMLQFIQDKASSHVFDICRLYLDTIDFKIREI